MRDKKASKAVISGLLKADGREITQIANDLGITKQRLGNYKDGHRFPDAEFIQLWQKKFGENIMALIEKEKDQSTNVSRETKKLTPVDKANDNKEKGHDSRIEVYRTIVEGHTEYVLIPRIVLNDTQLVSVKQIEKDKAYMDALIEFNRDLLAKIPNVSKVQKG
jgi:transcriptional regulator with XRE-family HTH domain